MSSKALIQYLNFLKDSGVSHLYTPVVDKSKRLCELSEQYANCTKCPLAEGRIKLVYGEGNPDAKAMLIGEAPGDNENQTGRPFVGAAGQLLDKMLAAINISREQIYIANIVKCRPPDNRNPKDDERIACMPYLIEQIQIVRPKILLVMGLVAAQTLFGNSNTLQWHREQRALDFMGIPAIVSYHPAALLRNPNWKRPAWEDLQVFQKIYEGI